MSIEIYAGQRPDLFGTVCLSVRYRSKGIDERVATDIRVLASAACGRVRPPLTDPAADRRLASLVGYIYRREVTDIQKPKGWLRSVVADFVTSIPAAETYEPSLPELVDDYLAATHTSALSESRFRAYTLLRRSLMRFRLYVALENPGFRLTVSDFNDAMITRFEDFLLREKAIVTSHPDIAAQPGCQGHTRSRHANHPPYMLRLLRSVLTYAVRSKRINASPLADRQLTRPVYGTPVYLSLAEMHTLAHLRIPAASARLAAVRDMFILQCCIGCRVSDLMRLSAANISPAGDALIYIARKSRRLRPVTISVPLCKTARRVILRHRSPTGNIFGCKISLPTYNRLLKQAFRLAGLDRPVATPDGTVRRLWQTASSHMARRTFVGNIYKRFKDQALVSALSGHAPRSASFARYHDVDPEMLREMVAVLD